MPEEPCPECEPITTRSSAGIEVRRFTPESAGPMPKGQIMAQMPERLLNHRPSPQVIESMRSVARESTATLAPPVEAAPFKPVVSGPSLDGPQTVIVTETPTSPTLEGPHYLAGSMVTTGPLAGSTLGDLGMFQEEKEDGEEVPPEEPAKCKDEDDPSYLKVTPKSGVGRICTLKKIAKKDDEGNWKDKAADVPDFPHKVFEPEKDAKGNEELMSEWTVKYKLCVCANEPQDVFLFGTQASLVQKPDKDGYPKPAKKEDIEPPKNFVPAAPNNKKTTAKSSALCCSPDKKEQWNWYCVEGETDILVFHDKGRRTHVQVQITDSKGNALKKKDYKIRQGAETGDDCGEWEDVK